MHSSTTSKPFARPAGQTYWPEAASLPRVFDKKTRTPYGFFLKGGCLTMSYFHGREAHYHRRKSVSRSCSGWEGVVPLRYGRQTKLAGMLPGPVAGQPALVW